MPAKTINMVGKMILMNGIWYTLCTERGCGVLTKIDPERMGRDGPVCGMHPKDHPRVPDEAQPTLEMLGKPGGNVFEALLKKKTPAFLNFPCLSNITPIWLYA